MKYFLYLIMLILVLACGKEGDFLQGPCQDCLDNGSQPVAVPSTTPPCPTATPKATPSPTPKVTPCPTKVPTPTPCPTKPPCHQHKKPSCKRGR